jgi:hypothetical protein
MCSMCVSSFDQGHTILIWAYKAGNIANWHDSGYRPLHQVSGLHHWRIFSISNRCLIWPVFAPGDIGRVYELKLMRFWLSRLLWAGIAQSVWRLATGWTVRGSNPGGHEIFQTGPGAHPAPCTMGTGSFPGVKWRGGWR